jgi:Domain of unknown function (DUF5666)
VRPKVRQKILVPIALCLLLASCGPSPQAGGGIGGTGNTATVVSGPITNTSPNNVAVSGYDYNTSSTVMTVDGASANQSDLKKGMVVLVNATVTHHYGTNDPPQRTANTLFYEDTVEGIVQSVAPDGSSLMVLGQTVVIKTTTIVDATIPGKNILNLVPGQDLIEVSGFVTGDGVIVGTLIDLKAGIPDFEIKGFIKNHDAKHGTFEIGALTVDYQSANVSAMPDPASKPWKDLLVDVRGSHVSPGGPGPYGVRMTATKIKPEGLGTAHSEDAEIEAFVTQIVASGDFYLGNVHVRTNAGTTFDGGTLNDIVIDAYLEVHGSLAGGIVNATNVEFKGETELEANVATVNLSDNTITLTGLADLAIQFDVKTALHGQGNPRVLADLSSGDHLQIHGQPRGGNTVLAKEVERSDPNSTVQLQGLVTSAADPFIVLLGASIDTSLIPESGLRGRNGAIGRSAFFGNLSSGKKVTLRGTYQGSTVTWSSASRGE